ncbi:hypothetical protein [Spirosoma endbachense]|uniref:Uncharacterized protein n=1 Tax=Spirosoma endbachense TaxID=2666025 RepID=A0A6P1W2Z8_9BACT|nr:hypothetical protein [Spirosoma endbachense]QHV98379.1 hypothetical protein GJR95_26765 [Spirosoma endbachense]
MLKSTNNKGKKSQTPDRPRVRAIKNGHTAAELAESGERWANHSGPYLTLEEVMALEANKQ